MDLPKFFPPEKLPEVTIFGKKILPEIQLPKIPLLPRIQVAEEKIEADGSTTMAPIVPQVPVGTIDTEYSAPSALSSFLGGGSDSDDYTADSAPKKKLSTARRGV